MAKKIDVSKLRKHLNLTQAAFAQRLGVDQATVSRLEAGDRPPSGPVLKLLEQIASQV